ncbi:MAG: TetR/AcrR family transcriptional regulator [Pseudomonadota bacterium]
MERKRREFDRREGEILEAALALFDGDDWESVTVEQIAVRAEIGKGTVYKHFGSKHEIYARLALIFYEGLLRRMQTGMQTLGRQSDVVTTVRETIRGAFLYHLERPEYRRVTQYCARDDFRRRSSAEVAAAFDALDERFLAFMAALLEPGIKAGLFPNRPIFDLTLGLHATFDGAITLLWGGCMGQPVDVDCFVDDLANFMIGGLMYQHQVARID